MKSIKAVLLALTILMLSSVQLMAQTKNYDSDWKKVNALIEDKHLPKSALEEVRKIYAKAIKENQDAQQIKSLVYMMGLQQETREDNLKQSINEIEEEIKKAKEPSASILNSLLARLYWQWLQSNRYQLYSRTNTVNFDKKDISTWTLEDLHKKIAALFLQSLKNEKVLKQQKLAPYDALIIKGNNRQLRPTLYDLLAHAALDYFKNDERDLHRPAYSFEISQEEAFAPASVFVSVQFPTRDSLSLQHAALLLFQKLIRFHLPDADPAPLIDLDIERVEFVFQHSVSENKDSLYLQALQNIKRKGVVASEASYLIAAWYEEKAQRYDPLKDTATRMFRRQAETMLQKIVADSSNKNETWTNSMNLLNQLRQPSLAVQIENVNLPSQPFRALVHFRNMEKIYMRLVKNNQPLKKALDEAMDQQKLLALLLTSQAVKNWEQQLPITDDLQQHNVEISIDGLPAGDYYLLASASSNFTKTENIFEARLFHVSSISFINQKNIFFVLDRESGQPLVNASATLYGREYDYNTSRYKKTRRGTYTTDRNGSFVVATAAPRQEYDYFLDLAYKGDSLGMNEFIYDYSNQRIDVSKPSIFFFTDRSIYRPGQSVFFKGIAIDKGSKRIAENYGTIIYLRNINYKTVDSVKVSTNEFGSFNGKFVIPQSGLNGNYQLVTADGNNSSIFSVEEYKRPKFHVEFDTTGKSYKVNEQITVSGNAKAYAGNNIQEAKVYYRVTRQPRMIYSWLASWFRPEPPVEITHGETITDNDGTFSIQFNALPDRTIDSSLNPLFDYVVNVDITERNGETRSGTKRITAGYSSLLLQINLPERLAADSFGNLPVKTMNMNGQLVPSLVTVTMTKLVPEQRLIRKRYWDQPDLFVMSKQEYISKFPHDEYKDETDYHSWPKEETVFQKSDSTNSSGVLFPQVSRIPAGFYLIQFSTHDKAGKEIKDTRLVELVQTHSKTLTKPEYLWSTTEPVSVEPGTKAIVSVGSSAPGIFLINQVERPQYAIANDSNVTEIEKNFAFNFYDLDKEKKDFDFVPAEVDRGGIGVNFFFVKDNRFYQYNKVIDVPWTNKQLTIEYGSFREKIKPGTEEKWIIKIKGTQKERIAAEVLASMYDASLDQFRMHSWASPDIWPSLVVHPWTASENFTAIDLITYRYYSGRQMNTHPKIYDVLSFGDDGKFGLLPGNGLGYRVAREMAPAVSTKYDEVSNQAVRIRGNAEPTVSVPDTSNNEEVVPRKNLNETAFFFPNFRTDSSGTIEFAVTVPEALTTWKLQLLAHTQALAFGYSKKELVTQKEIMVQPNMPRFLRQGDHMELATTIVNLSDSEQTGQVQLELFDASTNQSVDGWFINTFPNQYFTVQAKGSETIKFPIQVPFQYNNALRWRITARAGNFSDGEEDALPVLTSKVLLTETLPLPMRGSGTKNFTFEKLIQSAASESLQTKALTIEYTSNPAWYAVQALPYLAQNTSENAEQVFNRYYANAIAAMIVRSSPKMNKVFEQWRTGDSNALLSNLDKNAELKSILLEETPWVLEAASEQQRKKNIAALFDAASLARDQQSAIKSLEEMQSPNGGFAWFKGGPDDRYITQYILSGIGHLKKLGVSINNLEKIYASALPYLDKKIKDDYDALLKSKADLNKMQIAPTQVQYLYMRSFFSSQAIPGSVQTAFNFYTKQAQQFWTKQNKSLMAMIALTSLRGGNNKTYDAILKSLNETSIFNEELGRYWKENNFGRSWNWWYAPIETQSVIIEAFNENGKNRTTVDELRTWLLKNKQTNDWRTSKATADACYALLLTGTEWLSNTPKVDIRMGGATVVSSVDTTLKREAGTGYIRKSIDPQNVKPSMGEIAVTINQTGVDENMPGWGAVYWQYFEDIDKITAAATPLKLEKKLFKETNTDRGPVLEPINESSTLRVGDRIKVRIELRVDRDMDYVHMKDMRASALEPVNVLSGYNWQGGLGYYQSTKDATTNFFFNELRKGTYVFEYPLTVSQTGTFTNGITTIQCMYAPEFSAHSESTKIQVD